MTGTHRRTFFSRGPGRGRPARRWVAAVTVLAAGATGLLVAAPSSNAATTAGDYRFQDSLKGTVAGTPTLTNIGTGNTYVTSSVDGVNNRVLKYPVGGGVAVTPTTSLVTPTTYSIVMLYKPLDVSGGYHRLIDLSNGALEAGLYEISGHIYAYPNAETPDAVLTTSKYYQIVLTHASSGLTTVYLDGVQKLQFTDTSAYWTATNTMRFGKDNSSEDGPGAIARLRFYKSALTSSEVKALDREPKAGADLVTTAYTDSPGSVPTGGYLAYSATVKNNGPQTATGAKVVLSIPSGATFRGASSSLGTCAAPVSGKVTCQLGSLGVGSYGQALLVVTAGTTKGTISSTATASSGLSDPTPADSTLTQSTTVR
jgi:uncharacterized repeat protein (TIGR01451 family)